MESSYGHVRDLPRNAADIPATHKDQKWSRLGIDVEHAFEPLYIVPRDKKKQIATLRKHLKQADALYLATDDDREGEAISWHLLEVLKPPKSMPIKRIVFHEITKEAIQKAIESPRDVDQQLVEAQETRRILDRLYGYEVSPVLWKKVMPKLSAGRVQSVATRLVVERERERMAFVAADFHSLTATCTTQVHDTPEFHAQLSKLNDKAVANSAAFTDAGALKSPKKAFVLSEAVAKELSTELTGAQANVSSVTEKPYTRRPSPPFTTSTFQQAAGSHLKLSASAAMRAAQSLYEQGLITYMRTDSTTLAGAAIQAARDAATKECGADHVPDAPRFYKTKSKNAQEAHEAIRPAGNTFQHPSTVAKRVGPVEASVYRMIWQRTLASQMTDTKGTTTTLKLETPTRAHGVAEYSVSGTVISHQGFRALYHTATEQEQQVLPPLQQGDSVTLKTLSHERHSTQPPARYSEASLVKELEKRGVGRPSTYASIIQTIQNRGYVHKQSSALVPTFTAFSVVHLLEQHFPQLVDYEFTARMEEDLDHIATGSVQSVPYLKEFYFGNTSDAPGLKPLIESELEAIDAAAINTQPIGTIDDKEIVLRVGRYGPYVTDGTETASIPEDTAPDSLTLEVAKTFLDAEDDERILGNDPETGRSIHVKAGRFGPYVQLDPPEDAKEKPKTASLFQHMDMNSITLEDALQLLSFPKVLGDDPETKEPITAQNGRYGPYIKRGSDTRSLESEEQLLSITLEEAVALFKQPKRRRGKNQATARATLNKDLGTDPLTNKPLTVKSGRFGPYVTDGDINASLRTADDPETITAQRASELLQARRDRMGA